MNISFRKQVQVFLYAIICFFAFSLTACEEALNPCSGEYDVDKATECYDQNLNYDSENCRCY